MTEATPEEVREQLVEALELDLVGPPPGHPLAEERLPGWERPSNWYLTGFLVPGGAPSEQSSDPDGDDQMEEEPESAGLGEEDSEDKQAAKKGFFPSSMGLSFLVPEEASSLTATVRWGDYEDGKLESQEGDETSVWTRIPREAAVTLNLGGEGTPAPAHVPDSAGLELHLLDRVIAADGLEGQLPAGTRSVSVFLVNSRVPNPDKRDRAFVFQPELTVRSDAPMVGRPDLRGAGGDAWDDQIADLHYADTPEYATGHGVSVDWEILDGECVTVRTAWIPRAEVEKTETVPIAGVELSMRALGALDGGDAAQEALGALVEQYRTWIDDHRAEVSNLDGERRDTAEELLRLAGLAADRIENGIALLGDEQALDAFRVANRAVARALTQRLEIEDPKWRPFQLAFILLNLPGMADPSDPHRRTVDLLFFPTGGGKTEAYLGLSAFAMVLRRLRNPEAGGRSGGGVSVVMRYTLRLLTLDQLGRAAGLVCALELERETDTARYGEWPFEIGLWVGKAATPNVLGHKGEKRSDSARAKVRQYKNDPAYKPSPIPLEACPWCGTAFEPASFSLLPNDDQPRELRVVCANWECDFSGDRALPIVAVDESLYRRLPAFLVATVDKFAGLPWVGEAGALLGGVERHDQHGYYGAAEPGRGALLPDPLPAPDLVIQDELHLISGPLGTMAGLYEVAIDGLCARAQDDAGAQPKIVASTATVRAAQDQVQALFGRPITQVFPPPGPSRRDSFFARTVLASQAPARQYVGIGAQGRNPKVVMRKVWLALMGAAERAYREAGGHDNSENPADPYMTVVGYFNSLRELGGARRILEEEVQNTLKAYGGRRRIGEDRGLFRDRRLFREVVELTSRVPTDKVAEARQRLAEPSANLNQGVDCAIATNMISVGLDIQRLGLMGVLGQPKSAAEYIQATSRVGRSDESPGLVVTLLNVHKPRDRSHYERFRHFHATFYRSVEVGSVTPFSARALDRGMAGATVALARNLDPSLTPAAGASAIGPVRAQVEQELLTLFTDRIDAQDLEDGEREERRRSVHDRIVDLLDSWAKVVDDYAADGVKVQYQHEADKKLKPLLRDVLDSEFETEHHRKFRVNRSLRDVEPQVNLFMRDLSSAPKGSAQ